MAVAQDDSLLIQKRLFQPRIYWDYGQTLMLWQERSQKYEGGLEWLLFDKVQIFAEAGYTKINPNNLYKNIDYQSEGRFYRLGLGYLAYLDEVNRLGLGVRFAESSFKDEGVIFINSETINSPMRDDFKRSDLQATWIEIVLNSEKQLRLKKDVPSFLLEQILFDRNHDTIQNALRLSKLSTHRSFQYTRLWQTHQQKKPRFQSVFKNKYLEIPVLIHLINSLIRGQVKLTGDHTYVVVFYGPLIVILTFIIVD